ncbi:MAG: S24 family peptidase [Christensenellales bacterium]
MRAGHHSAQQQQSSNSYKREVNGLAAAGSPLYSTVDDESVTVPQKYIDSQRYIIIKAKGDSMVPLIQNGDYVIAEIDSTPCQGELSLVRVESSGYEDEYTIKKFYRYDDEVELHSINTNTALCSTLSSEIKAASENCLLIIC